MLDGQIQAVAFDAVGTLIEPFPPAPAVYQATARRQGVAIDLTVIRARFAQEFARAEESDQSEGFAASHEGERRRWRSIVSACLREVPDREQAFAELWNHFAGAGAWRVFPDVPDALGRLRANDVPAVIASNFDDRLESVVAGLPDIAHLKDQLIISSRVGARKPSSAFFAHVLARLGVPARNVVCVGDNPAADQDGAERAGLNAILLDRTNRHASRRNRIRSLAELPGELFRPARPNADE